MPLLPQRHARAAVAVAAAGSLLAAARAEDSGGGSDEWQSPSRIAAGEFAANGWCACLRSEQRRGNVGTGIHTGGTDAVFSCPPNAALFLPLVRSFYLSLSLSVSLSLSLSRCAQSLVAASASCS